MAAAVLWGSEGAAMVQNACDLGGNRPRASPEHYPRPAQVGMPNILGALPERCNYFGSDGISGHANNILRELKEITILGISPRHGGSDMDTRGKLTHLSLSRLPSVAGAPSVQWMMPSLTPTPTLASPPTPTFPVRTHTHTQTNTHILFFF